MTAAPAVALAPGLAATLNHVTLTDALATIGLAVTARPALPAAGGVMLRATGATLTLTGFDFDTAITVTLEGVDCSPGELLVDHGDLTKTLAAVVKGIPKRDANKLPVTVRDSGNGAAVLDLAGYTLPLTTLLPGDYPELPTAPAPLVHVDRVTFTRELLRVLPAASRDETLPILNGVEVGFQPGAVTLACTDRYRLTATHLTATPAAPPDGTVVPLHRRITEGAPPAAGQPIPEDGLSVVVPVRDLDRIVKRFTGAQVSIGTDWPDLTHASLTCGNITVTTQLVDGEFVRYGSLLEQDWDGTVETGRAALVTAAQRVTGVMAAKRVGKYAGLDLVIRPDSGTLAVEPVLEDRAEEVRAPEQVAVVDGLDDTRRVRVNPGYLLAALAAFDGATVTLHTLPGHRGSRPVLLTSGPDRGDTTYRHLLMTMKHGNG